MTPDHALTKAVYAVAASKSGKEIVAYQTGFGIRIIKGITDPTVVRKLRPSDYALDWKPYNVGNLERKAAR